MSHLRPITLRTPAGVTLDGVERGDAAGLPVLFLHGITDSWRSFEMLLPLMPGRYRALALTCRGHGDSARPEAGYRIEDVAGDIAGALDAAGIGRAAVVGHSWGTLVAQRLAADRPGLVAALVLIGPFVAPCRNPAIAEIAASFSTLSDPIDPAFARAWQEGASAPTVDPGFLDRAVAESLKAPARVWRDASRAMHDADLTEAAKANRAPTLILRGEHDAMCRAEAALLAGLVSQAELASLSGNGHAPHWEEPARVAALLVPFLDRQTAEAPIGAA